ncbi:MAG TPA: metal ABC transporter permease [Candidatus Hydrogenedens sp.]|nr:metal ABC transporter permease [Candidatus Hydrogenedens sp.]
MNELWHTFIDPNFPFLRYVFVSGILASISFGIVGSYVVTKNMVSLVGAISHSVLAGVGLALFLQHRYQIGFITPFYGALFAGILSAIIISLVSKYITGRQDAVIGAIWAVGMAIGMVFLAYTPGYVDPMSYLFGSTMLITKNEIKNLIFLDIIILAIAFVYYPQFWAYCFDEEFARVRNVPVMFLNMLLLIMSAVTVVMMMPMVGIILVLAQLSLPVLIAEQFVSRLSLLMLGSIILCMLTSTIGLMGSYKLDLPAGPVIVLTSMSIYILVYLFKLIKKTINKISP